MSCKIDGPTLPMTSSRIYFSEGIIANCTPLQSDSLLSSFISSVADNSPNGGALDASYDLGASALFTSIKSHGILNEYDLSGCFSRFTK